VLLKNKLINMHPNHPKLDYHYITDGIFIGTNQCCQTHHLERVQRAALKKISQWT